MSRSVGVGARGLWANARGSSACSSSTDTVTMLEIPREEKCSMSLTSWTLKLSLQRQKVVHLRHLPRKRPRFEVHFLHTVPRGENPRSDCGKLGTPPKAGPLPRQEHGEHPRRLAKGKQTTRAIPWTGDGGWGQHPGGSPKVTGTMAAFPGARPCSQSPRAQHGLHGAAEYPGNGGT